MFKRIDHIELVPFDFEKTVTFYTEILGFKIKQRVPVNVPPLKEVIYLTLGDSVVEFLNVENPVSKPQDPSEVGYKTLALEVENMNEAISFLKDKGVQTAWGPVDIGGSIRAEIRDPDGLTIELRQW